MTIKKNYFKKVLIKILNKFQVIYTNDENRIVINNEHFKSKIKKRSSIQNEISSQGKIAKKVLKRIKRMKLKQTLICPPYLYNFERKFENYNKVVNF